MPKRISWKNFIIIFIVISLVTIIVYLTDPDNWEDFRNNNEVRIDDTILDSFSYYGRLPAITGIPLGIMFYVWMRGLVLGGILYLLVYRFTKSESKPEFKRYFLIVGGIAAAAKIINTLL